MDKNNDGPKTDRDEGTDSKVLNIPLLQLGFLVANALLFLHRVLCICSRSSVVSVAFCSGTGLNLLAVLGNISVAHFHVVLFMV